MRDDAEFCAIYAEARGGSPEARAALVEGFRARLERFIERRMGKQVRRRSEPEDIFQTTVLALFDRLDGFPAELVEEELRAYVFQIAKWKIADVMKKSGREHGESFLPASPVPASAASIGPVTRSDERRWTREQIEVLPEKYSSVLRRYYVEAHPVAAIAEELGIKANLVKQRLARGRAMLRKSIETEKDGGPGGR